ncbi:MAG: DUF4440 domain-containing protein [Chloroflexota bacterium]
MCVPLDSRRPASETRPEIRELLLAYTAGDPAVTVGLFRDGFLALDPSTVTMVDRERFASGLPERARMFASIGATGTDLVCLDEHVLDEWHVLVDGTWRIRLSDADAPPLHLRSSFLLRREDDRWQVAVYINHQDVRAVIGERSGTTD